MYAAQIAQLEALSEAYRLIALQLVEADVQAGLLYHAKAHHDAAKLLVERQAALVERLGHIPERVPGSQRPGRGK